MTLRAAVATAVLLVLGAAPAAAEPSTAEQIGTSFPEGFPEIIDHSLGVPVIGFGSDVGELERTPVILLHGNNDTPYPTECNGAYGKIQSFAQHFLDHGYGPSELWALGYQGEQCDLATDPPQRSGEAHSTVANVPDLRAFVDSVLDFTGAEQVDIVGHSLGTTLAREWMRQDDAYDRVRRLVGVDGPNHGIINCSPNPRNFYQSPAMGGFTPDSAICVEYGADDTPLLAALNADPVPGPTEYLMIYNADTSFVFIEAQDGVMPPVPAENHRGEPHDFSDSAQLPGARNVAVTGMGAYDDALRAAHTGIVNSPEVWDIALAFLAPDLAQADPEATPTDDSGDDGGDGDGTAVTPVSSPASSGASLPASGPPWPAAGALLTLAAGALLAAARRTAPR